MRKILFFLVFSISLFSYGQNPEFIPPVKIPMLLSGSFAELRSNHFHSGIDIKTQGVTGIPVYSVANGFISRISVSPSGFGKALYIDHPNGTTSVYGHLNKFSKPVEEYIKNLQYKNESFRIDVPLTADLFPVKQGDEIAKSGNSGSSGGPHLHFEIRNTKTEEPLNPLKYNFPVTDKTPPKISNVLLVPLNTNSQVNLSNAKKSFPVVFFDGKYHIKNNQVIPVFGEIGFAVQANDYFDNSWNKCGIYSIEMFIDNELYFASQIDKFSFDETRYINSFIDYEEFIKTNRRFQKSFIDPGNRQNIYLYKNNSGIYNFNDSLKHKIQFKLNDTYGNSTELEFEIESKPGKRNSVQPYFTQIFKYNKYNYFKNEDIEIEIEEGSLYDDLAFQYSKISGGKDFFSDIHVIHKNTVPLHKSAEIQIKTTQLPDSLKSRAIVVSVDTLSGKIYSAGGKYSNGKVKTNILNFGNYAISVDTIPPVIIPLSISKNILTESNQIRFKITDNLAGINNIEGFLDGKWALFEYDQKNNLITHYFDSERFVLKKSHSFLLKVTDYKDNISSYEATFYK